MKCSKFCLFFMLILVGCDELRQKEQPRIEQSSAAPKQQAAPAPSEEKRFAFPPKSTPFPESSVALDTTTGQLCKTYSWEDNARFPKGLPLCSELIVAKNSFTGASKAYAGFTYSFDGTKWVKGAKALKYDEKIQPHPWSDDQYDPLNLFSKEEKAKRTLSVDQIQRVADQFGVSYEEALEEAKQQGYKVPPKH
jgi:hypothetical protein